MSEELPDSVQHTKERKPDALKKIIDAEGNAYILQIEFQLNDEREMIYRMAEYSIMLMRKYRLPIKQYVIFLRDAYPKMSTSLDTEHHKFNYTLIRLNDASYKLFLKSNDPEVKMLGILANFDNEEIFAAVKSIVESIHVSTDDNLTRSKYFEQLRILVKLRNKVAPHLKKAMESVSTFFRKEEDMWYREGEALGEAKKSQVVVENLIRKGFTDELAAEIAEVDLDFVKKLHAGLIDK